MTPILRHKRVLAGLAALAVLAGCSTLQDNSGIVAGAAGAIGGAKLASEAALSGPQYIAGAAVAYALYDPLAPTWKITVSPLDEERVQLDLRMRALATGGEGEARQVMLRNARRLGEREGYAGYEVLRYEEGVESTRPFARRVASAEIRLLRSRTWQ